MVRNSAGHTVRCGQQRIVNDMDVAARHRAARMAQHGRNGRLGAAQGVGRRGERMAQRMERYTFEVGTAGNSPPDILKVKRALPTARKHIVFVPRQCGEKMHCRLTK